MSRSPDPRDRGFSLIEVMVAIGIVVVLLVAIAPALVLGLQSNGLATQNTRARALGQAELERMRNLPFHVSVGAGDYVDVLDYYFPDASTTPGSVQCLTAGGQLARPATSWTGYVDGTTRCDWEPQQGPFFRRVRVVGDFVVVVTTQFLTSTTPPTFVTPDGSYSNHSDPDGPVVDSPPANQIGARVVVFTRGSARAPVSSSTQISRRVLPENRVEASVDVTAVTIGTTAVNDVPVVLEVGAAALDGEVSTSSEARAELRSVTASSGDGNRGDGAALQAVAPPAGVLASSTAGQASLNPASGCQLVCWGGTVQSGGDISAVDGLPTVGSPAVPFRAYIADSSNAGFQVRQGVGATYRPELSLTQPLARIDNGDPVNFGVGGGTYGCGVSESVPTVAQVRAAGGGWLRTTPVTGSQSVEACGAARSSTISLLPTTFAPGGVVQIRLSRASAYCGTTGGAHTPTVQVDYQARVLVWNGGPSGNDYREIALVSPGGDALSDDDPALIVLPEGRGSLGRYIASWSSPSAVTSSADPGSASAEVPGVVRILTQPLRSAPSAAVTPAPSTSPSPAPSTSTAPEPTATPLSEPTSATGSATASGEPTVSASPSPSAVPTTTPGDPASTVNLTVGSVSCSVEDRR